MDVRVSGEAGAPLGFDIMPLLSEMLTSVSLEDVELAPECCSAGDVAKGPGLKRDWEFRVQFLEMALEAYTLALFTRAGGWKNEEVQVLLTPVR
jgi:hypothetical protein